MTAHARLACQIWQKVFGCANYVKCRCAIRTSADAKVWEVEEKGQEEGEGKLWGGRDLLEEGGRFREGALTFRQDTVETGLF